MKQIRSVFAHIRFEANKKSCEYSAPYFTLAFTMFRYEQGLE
jgi:hypothetical protein